jgi:hypothetical protein
MPNAFLRSAVAVILVAAGGRSQPGSPAAVPPNLALRNGRWFNGRGFERRTVYTEGGRFTFEKPSHLDGELELAGAWIIPPFGEAHNHNIGTGEEERDERAVAKYLADGVFYVKIQGNLPLSGEARRRLGIGGASGIDAVFAQGSITASGGHPIALVESLLAGGYFPGFTKERLRDYRYFTVNSEAELERKWADIVALKPDFIKTFLWNSDEFEKRKGDAASFGQKGLGPRILERIVARAHACGLRVSTHVTDAADFRNAVAAGVDEIAHLPLLGSGTIRAEDAAAAARRGIGVDTTCGLVRILPAAILPGEAVPEVIENQKRNLRVLHAAGAAIAVGSDNVADSSVGEMEYLRGLRVFDAATLLRMWTEVTPRSIFPGRAIGELRPGFEASFLALDGDPLEDWGNVRRIRLRFKQGFRMGEARVRR